MPNWRPTHGKPLVCVTWMDADAARPTDAFDEKELAVRHKTTPVHTYGLLMINDDIGITLVNEYYDDSGTLQYRGKTLIPKGMVTNIEYLFTLPKPRGKKAPSTPQ